MQSKPPVFYSKLAKQCPYKIVIDKPLTEEEKYELMDIFLTDLGLELFNVREGTGDIYIDDESEDSTPHLDQPPILTIYLSEKANAMDEIKTTIEEILA